MRYIYRAFCLVSDSYSTCLRSVTFTGHENFVSQNQKGEVKSVASPSASVVVDELLHSLKRRQRVYYTENRPFFCPEKERIIFQPIDFEKRYMLVSGRVIV